MPGSWDLVSKRAMRAAQKLPSPILVLQLPRSRLISFLSLQLLVAGFSWAICLSVGARYLIVTSRGHCCESRLLELLIISFILQSLRFEKEV